MDGRRGRLVVNVLVLPKGSKALSRQIKSHKNSQVMEHLN